MKQKLISSLKRRINEELVNYQNPVKIIEQLPLATIVDVSTSIVFLYTRASKGSKVKPIYLVEVISAIGHALNKELKHKKDSGLAAKIGAFVLYSFEELHLIETHLGRGGNGHSTYLIKVLNENALLALWEKVPVVKSEKFPSEVPYAPWTSTRHPTGMSLVKTSNSYVLNNLKPETHPIVYESVNRAQEVGWKINTEIYDIHLWALRNKTDAFADIWEMQNPEAKASKVREALTIGSIARRFLKKTFYHLYFLDFRGRKYASTAYLHEQGSDLARGLLLRADKKAIGLPGYQWLLISLANNWGGSADREDGLKTDKIPLKDRVDWASANIDKLVSYARLPKIEQGWMQADKPWQFLAACIELKNLLDWQESQGIFDKQDHSRDYRYESSLECFVDGSNNGSQHLAALTKDEVTAPHVNLVPLPFPGDLYLHVAEHVWKRLDTLVAELTEDELLECNEFIDTLISIKKLITNEEPNSETRKELIGEIIAFKNANKELMEISSAVFWSNIRDPKHQRKIVKR
jgi:DNA-directed RNA polymerase